MQGPCYDFVQSSFNDMTGNTTLFNCMKDKMSAGNLPACAAMDMALAMCGGTGAMRGGGGGRRQASASCEPGQPAYMPAPVTLTKEMYDDMVKGIYKNGNELRCDPDGEVTDEDKDK